MLWPIYPCSHWFRNNILFNHSGPARPPRSAYAIILATIIYRYKGHIKIWLYTRFGFHPWNKVKENINEKEYDAFVSYNSNDWDWVLDSLMPQLEEEHGFKLCVHERDFDLGIEIKDNITKAIKLSRRTIVILMPEYAKSFWCNLEFLEAIVKAFNKQTNRPSLWFYLRRWSAKIWILYWSFVWTPTYM